MTLNNYFIYYIIILFMKSYILLGVLAAYNQAAVLKSNDEEFDNDPVRMIIA